MFNNRLCRNVLLKGVAVLFLFLPAAFSQSTAALQGTITDATGAVVPGSTVTAHNEGTGEERTGQSDSSGIYLISSLPVGTYRVEVKSPGMQTMVVNSVVLEVGRTVSQNFTVKVAQTNEAIVVQASSAAVTTDSVSVGTVIDSKTVQEIPLNGRHFVDLGLLIPGSVTPPQNGFLTAPVRGQGSLAFNTAGAREDTVNFMINGINLNDMVQNQITFQPTINTVQEFKVDNSTYSAEYGRNSGAIVNIATRSGTNEWHGEGFEFLRNNALDARNYFNTKPVLQSPFKRNQFGGDVGAPIWKDHTFFFLSYEGLRQRQGLTLNSGVLTDAQRAQAQSIANPTVLKLLPLLPAPNLGASFVGSGVAPVDIDQGTANISHSLGQNDRLSGYYAFQHDVRQEPTLQGNTIPGFGDTRESRRQLFTFNETHVFTPNIVNEARLGFNRIHVTFSPNYSVNPADFGINGGVGTAIGLPQVTLRDIGLNFGGPSGFPQGRGDYTVVLSDTLAWTKGRHSIKFGGEVRRFNGNNFSSDTGTLAFNTVDDFINGRIASFTVTPGNIASRVYITAAGAFVQDSFKLKPWFTIDAGLRYDWNGTPNEAQNRFVVFDQATASLLRTGTGIDKAYKQNSLNFEPRVGIAWDLFHNQKTVFRTAYAIQTDQPVENIVTPLASNPPFSLPVAFTGPGTVGFGNALTSAQAAGSLAVNSVNPDFKNPYVQSWNANIQQQITGSSSMMIGYFANKGTNLRISRNINQFLPGTTTRPYVRLSASSPISPGAGLSNITMIDSGGNSIYNGLWITATKRFAKGLNFNASYTFSKSIDYNSLNSQGVVVQDSYNIRADRGLSDFDARHRFVISGIYELPFKGNRVVSGWQISTITQLQTGNPVNLITGSTAITGVNSVRPDVLGNVITTGYNPAPAANFPNIQYIPRSVCSTPTTDCLFVITNHLGNLGRNVIIGPGFENVDVSLLKNTKMTERLNLQFRADVFDVANTANFGQPNRTLSTSATSTFGQITNTRFAVGDAGSSRQIQLAMKLIF